MTLQEEARCAAYAALMDEHCKPPTMANNYRLYTDYLLGRQYIADGRPGHARYHIICAGVPKDLIVAVDLLIGISN